jgi:hypothetical protein
MSRWQSLSRKLLMYKWPLLLVLLMALTDFFILSRYLLPLTSTEDRIKLITPLLTFNSVLLAGAGIMYQVQATNEREIQFKIHQQRSRTYDGLLRLIEKIAKITKNNGNVSEIEDEYRKLRPKMMVYASPRVLKAYIEFQSGGTDSKRDPILYVKIIAELYQLVRYELGFEGEDVPTRQMVGLLFTDIDEPKFNVMFDKNGYLLKESTTKRE